MRRRNHFDVNKANELILLYYYETSGRHVFICFLEEIEDTKKHFEIIWPLAKGYGWATQLILRLERKKLDETLNCKESIDFFFVDLAFLLWYLILNV